MIIEDKDKQIEYLLKDKLKSLKDYEEGDIKLERQRAINFVKDFNLEAKKQNSKWFAEFEECKSSIFDRKPFILTHIKKRIIKGWIFKDITIISLQVGCYEHHYSFVDNDFVVIENDKEKNNRFFKLLPEFRLILKNIPEVFFILTRDRVNNYELEVMEIEKDITKLEKEVGIK